MSAFSGRQGRGARAIYRAKKRQEAEERNAKTPDERRKKNRKKS
jgi:hypothetical protein